MITEENYYTDTTHASKSQLDKIHRSPLHYKHSLDNHEDTDPMRLGRAAHSFILENAPVVVCPFDNFRTKEAREWRDTHTDYVTRSEYDELVAMRDAIHDHPTVGPMLKKGEAEKIFTSEIDDIPVKCKVDWYTPEGNVIDLKTCVDASPRPFAYQCKKHRYDLQAAFYSDIIEQSTGKRPRFIFVALEKSAPYGVAVYEIDQESIENARLDYLDDLNRWITCRREGVYPGYDTEIQTLML